MARPAAACDSCQCTLARAGSDLSTVERQKWFFDFTFEQQNWETRSARDAHTLHHQGHDAHNKTHEEFYHWTLGVNPTEDVTLLAELPYVVRSSTEVDSHALLGAKQVSEGLGDLKLNGVYRFWRSGGSLVGLAGGVQLPTGDTEEKNLQGQRFEPELQPAAGDWEYTVGTAFQTEIGRFALHGNALYTFKTEGEQDFEFGDAFSTYLFLDTVVFKNERGCQATLGVDAHLEVEEKQLQDSVKVLDSGGTTILIGPSLSARLNDRASVYANFLLPAYQDLGGVHQELDFVWNMGAKLNW